MHAIVIPVALVVFLITTPAMAGGLFTPGPPMNHGRAYHEAVRLNDGRVLFVGGYPDYVSEIYDPRTGTQTDLPALDGVGASFGEALLLHDETVLIGGGDLLRRYDPNENRIVAMAYLPKQVRAYGMSLLADGRVLIMGGIIPFAYYSYDVVIYDPRTNEVSLQGSVDVHRSSPTSTTLRDGRVLFCGGDSASNPKYGPTFTLASCERFDPTTGTFTRTSMGDRRAGHTATLLQDGRLLITGGTSRIYPDQRDLATAEIFDGSYFRPVGPMSIRRSGHRATLLPDGRVLLVG